MENERKDDIDHASTGDEVEEIAAAETASDYDEWTTSSMPQDMSSDGKFSSISIFC